MRSEQEQLADLVSQDELEPVITGDILADMLREKLGDVDPEKIESMSRQIESQGDVAISTIKRAGATGSSDSTQDINAFQRRFSAEKVVLELYDIHEKLVEAFEGCSINSSISECLSDQINRIGKCITTMGGSVDQFEPLNHVSGLEMPDIVKNAEEVIQRTIQCYRLGKVKAAKIKEEGKEIHIVFEGVNGNTRYAASGRIVAKGWTGNEAIDYVYTPRSGKMSVKAFEGGRWINKNNTDNYRISWELEEMDGSEIDSETQSNLSSQNSAKKHSSKEELPNIPLNNPVDENLDGEEDIGSPIR